MTRQTKSKRTPQAFAPDDPKFVVQETPVADMAPDPFDPADMPNVPETPLPYSPRGLKWGGLLLSALTGLVAIAGGLWLSDLVSGLLTRQDWIGWTALGLLAIVALSGVVIVLREVWALLRLRRLGRLRRSAEDAVRKEDKALASRIAADLQHLYRARPDLSWARARLKDQDAQFMNAIETLSLSERELMTPLDAEALDVIGAAAKRVSVITAISPLAVVDMVVVAAQNMRMLRSIATIYGVRPGTLGLFKLARMVVTHIVLTGGIALGDDLIQQMIGQQLMAKLSARLGQGLFNGALTARIGLATIDVCRPLPFIKASPPRLRTLLADIARQATSKS
ncbi:MAG: TIGR01620 family protein [Hyphomicrobiaceae bacterium]|nr:TIGR01620 family protein [Hyphomicrobiaceae bacterium]